VDTAALSSTKEYNVGAGLRVDTVTLCSYRGEAINLIVRYVLSTARK